MTSNSSNDGQIRCKCKKSKCLKLYCECFAAGYFCSESCSCKDCFNSPDYEDTIEETRKQIEKRNPNAFSSKINCLVESPTSQNAEDGNQMKPIAGKHRRGCNCKKSMCLKKYCECYQANVGCSDECGCQGCGNIFGKRGDYSVSDKSIHETIENKMQSIASGFSLHEFNNPHNFTPTKPFQHLGHQYDSPTTGRCIPSPGSAITDTMLGTNAGNFDIGGLDQQSYIDVFMNQFTSPDTTPFSARHLNSVMNIPPMTDLPYNSTSGGSYSVMSSPGSLMIPVTTFTGPEVMNFNEKPYSGGLVAGAQLDFTR